MGQRVSPRRGGDAGHTRQHLRQSSRLREVPELDVVAESLLHHRGHRGACAVDEAQRRGLTPCEDFSGEHRFRVGAFGCERVPARGEHGVLECRVDIVQDSLQARDSGGVLGQGRVNLLLSSASGVLAPLESPSFEHTRDAEGPAYDTYRTDDAAVVGVNLVCSTRNVVAPTRGHVLRERVDRHLLLCSELPYRSVNAAALHGAATWAVDAKGDCDDVGSLKRLDELVSN
mmetsp:Transcript_10251/g.42538  ORF Transcript_10251/g.42538 Transcript_10251/m.42538 type:complete len:230 (+) Transcript_10251:206-895(+)